MKQKFTPFKTRWKYALLALMAFMLLGAGKAEAEAVEYGKNYSIGSFAGVTFEITLTEDGTLYVDTGVGGDLWANNHQINADDLQYGSSNGQLYIYYLTKGDYIYDVGMNFDAGNILFTFIPKGGGEVDPDPDPDPQPGNSFEVPGYNMKPDPGWYMYTPPADGWLTVVYSFTCSDNNLCTEQNASATVPFAEYNEDITFHKWKVEANKTYYFDATALGDRIIISAEFEEDKGTTDPDPDPSDPYELPVPKNNMILEAGIYHYTPVENGILTVKYSSSPMDNNLFTDLNNPIGSEVQMVDGYEYHMDEIKWPVKGQKLYYFDATYLSSVTISTFFEPDGTGVDPDEPVTPPTTTFEPMEFDKDYEVTESSIPKLYYTPEEDGVILIYQYGEDNIEDFYIKVDHLFETKVEADQTAQNALLPISTMNAPNGNGYILTYEVKKNTTYYYNATKRDAYDKINRVRFELDKEKVELIWMPESSTFIYNSGSSFTIMTKPSDAVHYLSLSVLNESEQEVNQDNYSITFDEDVLIVTFKNVGNYKVTADMPADSPYNMDTRSETYIVNPEVYTIIPATDYTEWNMENIEILVSYSSPTGAFLSTNSHEFTYSVKPLFDTQAKGEYKPGEEAQKQRLLDNGYELSHIDAEYYSIETIDVEDKQDGSISLTIHFPCSGVYELWAHAKSDNVYFTEADTGSRLDDVLLATVTVYPSFNNHYVIGHDYERGQDIVEAFNINGIPTKYNVESGRTEIQYPFVEDENGDLVLVNQNGLGRSQFYNPGTYFSDLYFRWTNETTKIRAERATVSPLATNDDIDADLTSQGYEKFDGSNLNLEFLNDVNTKKTLQVVAVKNGASTPVDSFGNSDAMFDVSSDTKYEVPTGVGEITVNEGNGTVEYYDLNGVKVNPENLVKGIYIKVENGKASKIAI